MCNPAAMQSFSAAPQSIERAIQECGVPERDSRNAHSSSGSWSASNDGGRMGAVARAPVPGLVNPPFVTIHSSHLNTWKQKLASDTAPPAVPFRRPIHRLSLFDAEHRGKLSVVRNCDICFFPKRFEKIS